MLNQLLLRGKQWLRIYKVGQVWQTRYGTYQVAITSVSENYIGWEDLSNQVEGESTRGFVKTWLTKLIST